MLGAVEPKFWANFCMELGRPDLVARHADAMPQTALIDEVGRLVAGLCREDIARRFDGKDCCVSLVRDLGETLAGPHVRDRRLVRTDGAGEIQSLLPVRIDGEPPSLRAPLRETDGTGNWSVPTEREHTGEKKSSDPPDPVAARTDARRSGE
jgi:alpha-methylacyl-CoA racemase